ncbi:hypothetical protein [Entomohabitans teleogrylli]|uniref:hypothetical protein n=1 Tax=Entomohabitans teleogrylli TaxID=1384589 RepID=UPI000B0D945A|nr:hypothetical protein [Entomohabitans teleogrylli]
MKNTINRVKKPFAWPEKCKIARQEGKKADHMVKIYNKATLKPPETPNFKPLKQKYNQNPYKYNKNKRAINITLPIK